jgi:hypothetical protein
VPKISISDIKNRWGVSRPTIMKAIKNGKLSGEKDRKGYWQFDPHEVVRWRGEPEAEAADPDSKPDSLSDNSLQAETIAILKNQVAQLESQVRTKDEQMGRLQDQMRDQTKLLEHHAENEQKSWLKRLFG